MNKIIVLLIFLNLFLTFLLLRCEFGSIQPGKETTADRIQRRGYLSETHQVTTDDGYILSMFRIVNRTNSGNSSRPVVLMMHGLTSSSDCWVIGDEGNVLAVTLASQGYDVWLGNCRGNSYSKRHISMCTGEKAFWRFSWHEIGMVDLPATIDYILKATGQTSLHYVGHSQGTAILFVLLSSQPKYNEILKTSHLLAPIAYMANARSKIMRYSAAFVGEYTPINSLFGDMPFMQQRILQMILGINWCRDPSASPRYCSKLFYIMAGGVSGYLNQSHLPEIFEIFPNSCSFHQAIHFVQLYVSRHFRPYDFGASGNLKRYGSSAPPDYNVENINPKYPLHFYYSDFDELSSKKDVEHFGNILGNKTIRHFIDLKDFSHFDFMWASNVHEVINRGIIERMNEVEFGKDESDKNINNFD